MSKVTIHCEDTLCIHNTGGTVYGVCRHPDVDKCTPYCGIDRIYRSSCKSKEVKVHITSKEGGTYYEGGTKSEFYYTSI